MKKFNEFMAEKQTPPTKPGVFDGGIESGDVNKAMSLFRRLLGNGVKNPNGLRIAQAIMRPAVNRLKRANVGADDFLLAIEALVNELVTGQRTSNVNRIKSGLTAAVAPNEQ